MEGVLMKRAIGRAPTRSLGVASRGHPRRNTVLKVVVLSFSLAVAGATTSSAAAVSSGDVLWSTPAFDVAAVSTSADGSAVFAIGCVSGESGSDLGAAALDPETGEILWDASFDGPDHLNDCANAGVASPDGSRVFVTGPSHKTADYPYDTMWSTVAYDGTTGDELWSMHHDPSGVYRDDTPYAIDVSPNGNRVFVTGFQQGADEGYIAYATIAYRASTGEQVWARTYPGGISYDIDVVPDGSMVVVTGENLGSDTTTAQDFVTIAYEAATGKRLWVQRYGGAAHGYDVANAVVAGPAVVYVTGNVQTNTSTGESKIATVAYGASDGAKLWAKTYGDPSSSFDGGFAVAVSASGGRVFVGGSSNNDMVTLAYANDGTFRWTRTLRPGGDASVRILSIVTLRRRVFVTGAYGTAVYDADSGAKSWSNKVGSTALAVSPDGSVMYVGPYEVGGVTAYAA
jgi:hypothetical protein